jgi:hypothetical protein
VVLIIWLFDFTNDICWFGLVLWCLMPLSTIFQLFRGVSFIGEGNRRKPDLWLFDLQLPAQSVPTITKVVSSNPVHGEISSIQHYVIKFVSDFRQVWFSPVSL